MERAWVKEHFGTGQQRGKKPHCQAKGVEQRQRRHEPVIGGKVSNTFNLLHVCQNALVTVNHPFRVPL